jgi:hypothetical protein
LLLLILSNYMETCRYLASPALEIFQIFGINPLKPIRLSEVGETQRGLRLYISLGKIIEGGYGMDSDWDNPNTIEVENVTFDLIKI